MKIARFRSNGRTAFGVVQGDEVVEIRGSIFTRFRLTDTKHSLQDVKLLPPTEPSEIWCPGLNFANHLEFAAGVLGDENPTVPEHPEPWIKARGSLTGTGEPIVLPSDSTDVHYEGEAVAVIGKLCHRSSESRNSMLSGLSRRSAIIATGVFGRALTDRPEAWLTVEPSWRKVSPPRKSTKGASSTWMPCRANTALPSGVPLLK